MDTFIYNFLLLFCIVLTLFLVVTFLSHIFIPVPFIPTPKKVIKQILKFSDIKESETIYDLGAGDGRMLIAAKKLYPTINAIGVEFMSTVWLLGRIRIWFSKENINWVLGNALKKDVSDADCIFVYLLPDLMAKLETKFDAELKSGTRVVSYAFIFPNKEPVKEEDIAWLSGNRKLRMYVW
jgi:type I restriction-modification system DNA methylase subunit